MHTGGNGACSLMKWFRTNDSLPERRKACAHAVRSNVVRCDSGVRRPKTGYSASDLRADAVNNAR
jgi:hypothetical protein